MTSSGASAALVAAVDIGGTGIKGGLLEGNRILLRTTTPTHTASGPDGVLQSVLTALADMVASAPDGTTVAGLGVVSPGTVDEARGVVIDAENLGWHDVPLAEIVRNELGLPVGFGHDVRAGGLAEWRYGAGVDAEDLIFLPVGTGIAAALVLGGRLLSSGGYAGEIGHGGPAPRRTSSPGADLACPCGATGCPETFASAAGMARRYEMLTGTSVDGAAEVLTRQLDGDPVAATVWDDAVAGLGELVSDLVRVTGVSRIVIGGGLVGAGDHLLEPLRRQVSTALTVHRAPRIVPAQLGADAGLYGASLIGWQAVRAA
ncbi:MAG TPA: ROK family protein [Jiangellaceae bacterium]|nr:ROK family protein [Jiangellaceae bacterium]